jgi:zinc protease
VYKRILSLAVVSACLSACHPSSQINTKTELVDSLPGVSLISEEKAISGQVSIPYQKYRLDNGLTVILHEDNSDPLVHVDVTYHVGSAREEPGKSGFAHFFEHMMFQGSQHVADEEHFKIITEAGGEMNGSTNSDRTNYYETVPANQLETMLWLEADRMGFLLDSVTQEKFEVQRATVKNERGESYDNQPYGLRSEKNSEALYPPGHPYSWSTIGYVEDLDRVNVDDLKAFFSRWYGPNNAVLTIGGDIDVMQTLQWVNKYFGAIPKGPAVNAPRKELVTLAQDRYVTLPDDVYLPLLQITFPTVYARHEDEAPLDVLSDILGGGKTSLFYKNLVKDGFAVQAVVSHPCQELACEFQLVALANPASGATLTDIEQRMQQTLIEFESRGVQDDDLNRTKAGIESSTIFALQSVSGKVSTLAANQTIADRPDMVQYDLNRYNKVTAEDVMRVYKRYIKDQHKVVLSIVPKGQEVLAAKPANFEFPQRVFADEPTALSANVQAPEVVDKFDRSIKPKVGPNSPVSIPDFSRKRLANGIEMIVHHTNETPTVAMSFSMEGGPLLDPIEKAGLASLTAQMLNESSLGMSNEEMANQLALLGSRISFSASGRYTEVNVSSLSKNFVKTLDLLKMKLFQPAFLQSDFDRLKQRLEQSLQQQMKSPAALASNAVKLLLFGEENRVSLADQGSLASLQNISLDDVKTFYKQYYSPAKADLVLVGDLDQKVVDKNLQFLTNWQGKDYQIPAFNDFPDVSEPVIYLVNQPGAAQSVIRIIKPDLPYDALGEQFRSKLMNFALGGNFNSRINLNLREDKGYTYGASTGFSGGKALGWFQAQADVKQANTADAIQEFFKEIRKYQQEGMTEQELISMRSAYTQGDALQYETPYDKASFLRQLLTYELDKNYREQQNVIIEHISLQEINQLATKHLKLDDMQVVVVGDAEVILPQLQSLGRKIVPLEIRM